MVPTPFRKNDRKCLNLPIFPYIIEISENINPYKFKTYYQTFKNHAASCKIVQRIEWCSSLHWKKSISDRICPFSPIHGKYRRKSTCFNPKLQSKHSKPMVSYVKMSKESNGGHKFTEKCRQVAHFALFPYNIEYISEYWTVTIHNFETNIQKSCYLM